MLTFIMVAVFLTVGLIAYAGLDLVFSDDRRVQRRLKDMTSYEQSQALEVEPLLRPFSERVLVPVSRSLLRGSKALFPASHREALRVRLIQAGLSSRIEPDQFFVAQILCAVGVTGILAITGIGARWQTGSVIFVAALGAVLGFMAPDLWLRGKRASRKRQIIRDLPDMLDMLTISVEAGLGFDAALSKLVRTRTGPLAEEFGRMLQEVQAGASRKGALRNLAERIETVETSTFVASIIQADMFGVSIAKVLRTQAGEMRLKRRQHAEEEAQKAPVKMVIPLVLCILPATMIVVMGPSIIRIIDMFAG